MTRPHARSGITRIEVAVLVVILVVLGCLAVSGILVSRVSARRQQCADNLRLIATGLRSYEAYRGAFPYGTLVNDRLPPERRWSWFVGAWAFVGEGQTELLVDLDKAWDGEGNRPVRASGIVDGRPGPIDIVALPVTHCPANPVYDDPARQDATSYVGMAGIGSGAARLPAGDLIKAGIWGYDRQTRQSQITRGEGFTILLAETGLDGGPWMAGGPPTVRGLDPERQPLVGPGAQFGGLHPGGCQMAMADGKVRFTSDGVDPEVLLSEVTVAVEEPGGIPPSRRASPPAKHLPDAK